MSRWTLPAASLAALAALLAGGLWLAVDSSLTSRTAVWMLCAVPIVGLVYSRSYHRAMSDGRA